jgi:hypothetical protein
VHAIATAGDVNLLPRILDAVTRYRPVAELVAAAATTSNEPILGRPG